ncbi:hypothetical protein [Paraburkholderia caribensis]|uniref:hypothetical protein n=1 Tax=Paraburkholderia caribensis TaxID=75105 RepID=UPI0034D1E033
MRHIIIFLAGILMIFIGGCSGLTQVQDSVTKFDQGAHTIATAQVTFFRSAQTADCNFHFYTRALEYSHNPNPTPGVLPLMAPCDKSSMAITDDQIALRQNLLNTITLYADQIQAVASTDSDKTLSDNARDTAKNINDAAKALHLTGSATPVATGVEAAVIAITNMVLNAKQLRDIKAAAQEQSVNLKNVVSRLKIENINLAKHLAEIADNITQQFETSIATVKRDGILVNAQGTTISRANNSQVYLLAITARQMLLNTPPAGIAFAATNGSTQDPVTVAGQINSALDSLVQANDSIASATTGGLIADVSDLVARAQAAQTMQTALAK